MLRTRHSAHADREYSVLLNALVSGQPIVPGRTKLNVVTVLQANDGDRNENLSRRFDAVVARFGSGIRREFPVSSGAVANLQRVQSSAYAARSTTVCATR